MSSSYPTAIPLVPDAEVTHFIHRRFGRSVSGVIPLGAGAWSRAYSFTLDGADLVIRFGAHREDFAKDRLAAQWRAEALPIPDVLEIGAAFGGHYAISQRATGEFLDQLDGATFAAVLPELWRTLDALRTADISATTGYGGWDAEGAAQHASWRSFLLDGATDHPESRMHGWTHRLDSLPDARAAFGTAYAELQRIAPEPGFGRHLIHGDTINRNVFVEGLQVSAVIDWGCALYGDFLYDVAWICFWAPWYESMRNLDIRGAAREHLAAEGADMRNFDQRMRSCELHIGLSHIAYHAFNGSEHLAATVARTLAAVATPPPGLSR